MTQSAFGDLVLPDISYKLSDYYDEEKKAPDNAIHGQDDAVNASRNAKVDVLIPSAGIRRRDRNSEVIFRIEEHRKSMVRKATAIFLSEWKSMDARKNFRNLVRAVIRANRWKINLTAGEDATQDVTRAIFGECASDNINFNVHAYKTSTSRNLGLSRQAQCILLKDPWDRTNKEKEILFEVVNQMKCFAKYSPLVRRELSTVIHFETFEDGRVIIQEGYQGISMYFIVTGSVTVQVKQTDSLTGDKKNYIIGEISAGSSFGELALIQECTRTATIVCKGTSQFLRVDKSDFHMVSRRSYEKEWQDRLNVVKSLPFFASWDETDLRHITLNCFMEEFKQNTVIMGNTDEISQNIYFILSGICKVAREVKVLETTSIFGGPKMLSLPPSETTFAKLAQDTQNKHEIKTRFLHTGLLKQGHFFGVGENLTSCYIMAQSARVECLLVPRHSIAALERVDMLSGNALETRFTLKAMMSEAQGRVVEEGRAFENWMTNLKWRNYKKKVIKDVLDRKATRLARPSKAFQLKDYQLQDKLLPSVFTPLRTDDDKPRSRTAYSKGGYLNKNHVFLPKIKLEEEEPERKESLPLTTSMHERKLTVKEAKNRSSEIAYLPTPAQSNIVPFENLAVHLGTPRDLSGKRLGDVTYFYHLH